MWAMRVPLQDIRPSDLDFDLSRSHQIKCDGVIPLHIYGFLLMVNSNLWPNLAPLRDIRLWNPIDLDFDLWRSLKVKCHSVIGLTIHSFLLMDNSNIWPNLARLRDIRLWSMGELDFDLKSGWPWLQPFKVTQGQIWWCRWTPHIWFRNI